MPEIWTAVALFLGTAAAAAVLWRIAALQAATKGLPSQVEDSLAEKHRAMLSDLHGGLLKLHQALADSRQATAVGMTELRGEVVEQLLKTLADQARADRQLLQSGLEALTGIVNERLDEGFKKTNETFANVMARLATIDEAQKMIDGLTSNVVSLQELLGDKKARGAFGEVQLEALVRNILPPGSFEFQYTLGNGTRADCVLRLPEPTGLVAVDSKFPLENYHRMFAAGLSEVERRQAQAAFRADLKRHIDAIGAKYIIPNETSDGAVMFVPAEAVFAEIHAYHAEVVAHALHKRVWIVSPTTLMAVLNTARAVLKDVETRRQIHVIKDALGKLAKDFARFDERMQNLARHIDQAQKDVQEVQVSAKKISGQFARIEGAELDEPAALAAVPYRKAADQ
jgi:DNA recombination protein RmuC